MLNDRIYKPAKNALIYHYCSAETFNAICSNKTIRLCDIFSMNDFLEMHWGYSIWLKVANALLPEIGHDFIDSVDKVIHYSSTKCLVLASCFSFDGDVLSQWRAYANDGQGYVIGFDAKVMKALNVKVLKVEYSEAKQIKELNAAIKALYEVEGSLEEEQKFSEHFVSACSNIAYDLASFKNPAFAEEKEIRLVHLLNFEKSNNSLKLVDNGGTYFGKDAVKADVKFMISQNIPKTYIDVDFTNSSQINPIREVIIGPKNPVLNSAIEVYLETLDIGLVKVRNSKASYR